MKQANGVTSERSRWRVQRGQSGRIYSIAVAGDRMAMAGYGALGNRGEIILVDLRTGRQETELLGHSQTVVSVSFAPGDPSTLASMDMDGKLLVWSRQADGWKSQVLLEDTANAAQLRFYRRLHPIRMVDSNSVIAPRNEGSNGSPAWSLHRVDREGRSQPLPRATKHIGLVTAVSFDTAGNRLCSADERGRIFLHDLRTGEVETHQLRSPALWLDFRSDGRALIVATAAIPKVQPTISVWNTTRSGSSRKAAERSVDDSALSCIWTGKGNEARLFAAIEHHRYQRFIVRSTRIST